MFNAFVGVYTKYWQIGSQNFAELVRYTLPQLQLYNTYIYNSICKSLKPHKLTSDRPQANVQEWGVSLMVSAKLTSGIVDK